MVLKFIWKTLCFKFSKEKYIAAVSGGPDSMWMLNKYHKKITAVCFVNYQKRPDTWYEEKIVNEFCTKHQIKFFAHHVDWNENSLKDENNFQALARKIRYDFFYKIAKEININNLLVGHNYNDFLETAYFQIARNSAALYYGILQESSYKELRIFRPILFIKKATIENLCKRNNVSYNIDSTNELEDYERNKNRKIILQMNRKDYHELIKKINRHNYQNKNKLETVNHLYNVWKEMQYDIDYFIALEDDYKFHIIYLLLINNNFGKITSNKINGIIDFITAKNNKKFRVSDNNYLAIKNNLLIF
ncbi:MAG: tRNA lysidine(34) synthetase TilS [Mycoplasmoidaceae bacterium]